MFEMFNEKARRVIFFARYEASTLGGPVIETEHLLLGVLREDALLKEQLPLHHRIAIRRAIEQHYSNRESISTSVDMPLRPEAARALDLAKQEADQMKHSFITPGHLVLGLLQVEDCYAAKLLNEHGIAYASYSPIVRGSLVAAATAQSGPAQPFRSLRARPVDQPEEFFEYPAVSALAPSLDPIGRHLSHLLEVSVQRLDLHSESYAMRPLKRIAVTRAEALGHMIDLATAHHQLFARALAEAGPLTCVFPAEDWTAVAHYRDYPWPSLVDTWVCLNRLLLHVLLLLPEAKAMLSCRVGIEPAVPRTEIASKYVETTDDLLGQILGRL